MMAWREIKDATTRLFARLCGLSHSQIRWSDESGGSTWTADPHLEITASGEWGIGDDEERVSDAPGAGADIENNVVTICGPRQFTLSVACESLTGDIGDPRSGAAVLSRLNTRLQRTTSVDELMEYYAVMDMQPIQRVPYRDKEGRLINKYILDLLCLTADNDVDRTVGAGGWIGEVIGTGTVTIAGGAILTAPLDVKEES